MKFIFMPVFLGLTVTLITIFTLVKPVVSQSVNDELVSLDTNKKMAADENGWLHGWSNRIQLTIDHTKIQSSLINFPLLVHLSTASGITQQDVSLVFEELGSDDNRKKIAVTTADGLSECFVEIQKWDTLSHLAFLWVKVPHISSSQDTDLFLYFDKNHADNIARVGDTGSTPAEAVWSENYVVVQHLEQEANGTLGEFKDSSGRNNNGTGYGFPTLKPGPVGGAQFFDGDNDYILIPDSDDLSLPTTGYLTISWWFGPTELNWRKNDGSGNHINMLGKGGYPDGWEWCFGLGLQTSRNKPQQINLYHHNTPGGKGIGVGTSNPYKSGEWIYVVGRFDDTNVDIFTFYPSGLERDTNIYTKATGYADAIIPKNTWSPLSIGTIYTQWQMYEGFIDELHVSNVFRSDDWIMANYYSETDRLLYYRLPDNNPPLLHFIGDKTLWVEQPFSFTISATDREGDLIVYSASNLPPGAGFDTNTGTFSWTPIPGQAGVYPGVRFEVSDGEYKTFEEITLTVNEPVTPLFGQVTPSPVSSGESSRDTEERNLYYILGITLAVTLITGSGIFLSRYFWLRKHMK
jgi:hypothetical protein